MFSGANDQADATRRTFWVSTIFAFASRLINRRITFISGMIEPLGGGHVASDNKESGGDGMTVKDEVRHEMRILVREMRIAGITYAEATATFRRQFVFEILNCNSWNQCKAAKALGVHRNTIGHMLDELGIDTKVKALSSAKAVRASMGSHK
jgi:DNA-binding protein Fis